MFGAGVPLVASAEDDSSAVTGFETVCDLIEAAAAAEAIPVDFFTRLIWRESAFRPTAISPKGARGIAQFMPGTAAERGLADPFDVGSAIPASAGYLKDLAGRFGSFGLAAAAYNAGPERVDAWLGGSGGLPIETEDYVLAVTGRSASAWKAEWAKPQPAAFDPGGAAAPLGCIATAAALGRPGGGATVRSAAWKPWGVQVAGGFSEAKALADYSALKQRFPALLAGDPLVLHTLDRSRGTRALTAIRVPADTRQDADTLCGRLTSAGGACVVIRNR